MLWAGDSFAIPFPKQFQYILLGKTNFSLPCVPLVEKLFAIIFPQCQFLICQVKNIVNGEISCMFPTILQVAMQAMKYPRISPGRNSIPAAYI